MNALFYDATAKSIIRPVGGLESAASRDPIDWRSARAIRQTLRMLRAAVLGARLDFHFDDLVADAMPTCGT
jgi:tRNA nucleotidyltransferase/poly(A) polymerase